MAVKKRGLGRGLDALLPKGKDPADESGGTGLGEIPVEWIQPGKYQPRHYFSEESLAELAASIKAQGVIQPVLLRVLGKDSYEIIAGERRWRAAQMAGLSRIPAVIRNDANDEAALAMSLIENIQREDLNPLEEARALQRLIEEFQFTHQKLADAVGKSRTAVTNSLRLINLAVPVAEMLEQGKLEMGHARALLALDSGDQPEAARLVVSKELNVRQTEALVKNFGEPSAGKKGKAESGDGDTRRLERNLGQQLGQPVQIKHSKAGKGKMVISYSSLDELDGILDRLGYKD